MPPSQVDWGPGLVVLAVGLVVGAVFVWRAFAAGRSTPAPATAPLALRDLAARREVLFSQLRELEDTAAKRSPEQLARERYALELDAARVLRDLASHGGRPAGAPAPAGVVSAPSPEAGPSSAAAPTASPRPAVAGFLWGIGSAAVLGLLVWFVSDTAQPRAAGGSPTGTAGPPMSGASGAAPEDDPELAQIQAAVADNPADVDAQLALARAYLSRRDMMGVWTATQAVLEREPDQPQALSYQALVRLAMGQADVATQMLQGVLETSPDLIEAHINLALVYFRSGREAQGEATMQEALRRFPEHADLLTDLLGQMKAQGADPELAAGGENPHAGVVAGAAPGGGTTAAPAAPVAPAAAAGAVRGVVELAPGVTGAAGSIVFIVARAPGGGPPAAVKRLVASGFPLPFELSAADSMMGQPLPDTMRLDARIDLDGDAMSRDPSEPSATLEGVRPGTGDVRLVLSR